MCKMESDKKKKSYIFCVKFLVKWIVIIYIIYNRTKIIRTFQTLVPSRFLIDYINMVYLTILLEKVDESYLDMSINA